MFSVRLDCEGWVWDYLVRFTHLTRARETFCYVYCKDCLGNGAPATLQFSGVARCHPDDVFSKELGRRISLASALNSAGIRREDRKRFFRAYETKQAKDREREKERKVAMG